MLTNPFETMIEISEPNQDKIKEMYQCKVRTTKHFNYEQRGKGSAISVKTVEQRMAPVTTIFSLRLPIADLLVLLGTRSNRT